MLQYLFYLVKVREVKEELRSMRLEAHTKQLSKELKSARAALEQERKLRKVQSDTIKVNQMILDTMQLLSNFYNCNSSSGTTGILQIT